MVKKLTKKQIDKITRSQERKAWKIVRGKVLERDGHRCLVCGTDYKLNVHHLLEKEFLIFRYLKYDIRNLVSLCPNCHKYGPFSIHRNPLYVLELVRKRYINNYKFLLNECKELYKGYEKKSR